MRRVACMIPSLLWLACAAPQPAAAPETEPTPSTAAPVTAAAAAPAGPLASLESRPSLREPEWLPHEAREMLGARMDRHGEEMMLLLVSVMTLHHEDTELLAEQVAAEPRLGRPAPGEKGTINALLPARFFELQDQLTERAHAIAAAARAKDNGRIVRAYGQLAETCVSCHSVYLTPESELELGED